MAQAATISPDEGLVGDGGRNNALRWAALVGLVCFHGSRGAQYL